MAKIKNRERDLVANDKFSRFQRKGLPKCHYCGIALSANEATREHITPVSSGGSDRPYNIKLACQDCNKARASYNYRAFLDHMRPVREARKNGSPIPDIPKFIPPNNDLVRTDKVSAAKEKRLHLIADGYTKELLFECHRARHLIDAGRSFSEAADILSVDDEVVRALYATGSLPPNKRLEYAQSINLPRLISKNAKRH